MNRQEILDVMVWTLALLLIAAPAEAQNANLPSGAPALIVEGSGDVSAGGQAAARKGDRTDDGQTIAGGSGDVFINGRPAVTAGERTGCGGVTVGGASNIFVNGKPIARSGDLTAGCPQK
jgi:uncharacterized Zn-binding protein involved in type VI secretion